MFSNCDNTAVAIKLVSLFGVIKIEEEPKRNFYLNECINFKWSVRELQRNSLLNERLTLAADKKKY